MRKLRVVASVACFVLGGCVADRTPAMEKHADKFDRVSIGMSPDQVRQTFPKLFKSGEFQDADNRITEYRWRAGSQPNPNGPEGLGLDKSTWNRVPDYIWFYFMNDRLVQWNDERVDFRHHPDLIVEWRER